MIKEYVLCNHETGEFFLGYKKEYIEGVIDTQIKAGADLENLSLYLGDKKVIDENVEEKIVYNIKD